MDDYIDQVNPMNYGGFSLLWNEETRIVSIFKNGEFIKRTLKYTERENAVAEAKRIVDFLSDPPPE
jgi:hypothetical protein